MVKATIIEVQLDFSIDDIIERDIAKITGAAKQVLDDAIVAAKNLQLAQQLAKAPKPADQVLLQAYDALLTAKEQGLPVEQVMTMVQPHLTTSSGFTLKLKHYLKEHGNPYMLLRKKVDKKDHYILEPFNEKPDERQNP